jgi:hypothetical protein
VSEALYAAVVAAKQATLELQTLMAEYRVSFEEIELLPVKPGGLGRAHAVWTARMVDVVQALARADGIPDASKLPGLDQLVLTNRAYDLVIS